MHTVAVADLPALETTVLGPGPWHEVSQQQVNLFADASGDHQWIPKGTRNKYEYDHERHVMRLDRRLFTATVYPADDGFLDGDPDYGHVRGLDDLPRHLLEEIEHFFNIYNDLQPGKSSSTGGADLGIGSAHAAVSDQELARRLLGVPEDRFCAWLIALGVPAAHPDPAA